MCMTCTGCLITIFHLVWFILGLFPRLCLCACTRRSDYSACAPVFLWLHQEVDGCFWAPVFPCLHGEVVCVPVSLCPQLLCAVSVCMHKEVIRTGFAHVSLCLHWDATRSLGVIGCLCSHRESHNLFHGLCFSAHLRKSPGGCVHPLFFVCTKRSPEFSAHPYLYACARPADRGRGVQLNNASLFFPVLRRPRILRFV